MMARAGGLAHERRAETPEAKERYTPAYVFEGLPIAFDLDPCASPLKRTPCRAHYDRSDDGFARPWNGEVWLNPPYGRDIPAWLARLEDHGKGIALLFARTDTRWFHQFRPHAVLFLLDRIYFLRPDLSEGGRPGAPSMLAAYGARAVRAPEESPLAGTLYVPAQGYRDIAQPSLVGAKP